MERSASLAPDLVVKKEDLSERIRAWTPPLSAVDFSSGASAPPPLAAQSRPGSPPSAPYALNPAQPLETFYPAARQAGYPPAPLPEQPGTAAPQHHGFADWAGPRHTDQMVLEALAQSKGNKTRAAKILGLTREGLRKRMKKMEPQGGGAGGGP
jgi:DNA-binding NtrC family response regulator